MTTHTITETANPFLRCHECQRQAIGYHMPSICGCEGTRRYVGVFNFPCGHTSWITSVCPSWGPVDGCTCEQLLGSIPHGPAPEPAKVVVPRG